MTARHRGQNRAMKAVRVHAARRRRRAPVRGRAAAGAEGEARRSSRSRRPALNYIDVYHRTGAYKGAFPSTLGVEGAGTVAALGARDATELRVGDRVASVSGWPARTPNTRRRPRRSS